MRLTIDLGAGAETDDGLRCAHYVVVHLLLPLHDRSR